MEDLMNFGVTCKNFKCHTIINGELHIQFDEAQINHSDKKHVVKMVEDYILIEELNRRHDGITIIFNDKTEEE
jgi:hypothetical protein